MTTSPVALDQAEQLLLRLVDRFSLDQALLTGIKSADKVIVVGYDHGKLWYEARPRSAGNYFGTGDIFASVLLAGMLKGQDLRSATKIAMDFITLAIRLTPQPRDARFGVDYAAALPYLLEKL